MLFSCLEPQNPVYIAHGLVTMAHPDRHPLASNAFENGAAALDLLGPIGAEMSDILPQMAPNGSIHHKNIYKCEFEFI